MRAISVFLLSAVLSFETLAGPIGIGDFSGGETVTTFDGLGLPFSNGTPLVFDGNTYTTDNGSIRYTEPNSFDANCNLECIGNDSDLGWIDVALGMPAIRVGALIGGNGTSYMGFVDFFGAGDALLGTVNYGNNVGLEFVGWEELSGITRARFHDTASNGLIVHMDDFRFEGEATSVPAPSTLALVGLGLLGLSRRRRA